MGKQGQLIYICGIDGAGKTTLAKKLSKRWENTKYVSVKDSLYFTEQIRKEHGDTYREYFSPYFRGVQWALDMLKMSNENISPLLKKGTNVIIDRYFLCNLVYTSIKTKNQYIILKQIYKNFVQPNKIYWLNVDPKLADKRIEKRGLKRAPKEYISQLYLAREKYKKLSLKYGEKIKVLNASTTEEAMEAIEKDREILS
ncbi:dTMP kinase [Lactobacillus helsingborgensis]|uniref:dTMP kinase n=1 Tax=Lactobacillus helsingborgensis TaxID=1218494 RepID=UPI0016501F22|nr:dTMP kinase [Lactobacillus helsingborgensis]